MREFWIYKGTSNFCNELDYDFQTETFNKCHPDSFYDKVSTKDTIDGGIHVIEYLAYDNLKKQNEVLVDALNLIAKTKYGLELSDYDNLEYIADPWAKQAIGYKAIAREALAQVEKMRG